MLAVGSPCAGTFGRQLGAEPPDPRSSLSRGASFPNCTFAFGCLQESLAVERYMANLAPVYAALTATQKATDDMASARRHELRVCGTRRC